MRITDQASPETGRNIFHVVVPGQAVGGSFNALLEVFRCDHVVQLVVDVRFLRWKHARNEKHVVVQRKDNFKPLQ